MRGQVLLVGGEAGIGKTTLLRRFCEGRGQSVRVLWGACDPLFTPSPLGPLLGVAEESGGELEAVVERGAMPYEVVTALAPGACASAGRAGCPTSAVETGFGAGLTRLYWKTPGMHEPNDPRPTQQGSAIAKDVWLVGAGLTMLLDDLLLRRRGNGRRKRAPRNRMAPRLRLGAS